MDTLYSHFIGSQKLSCPIKTKETSEPGNHFTRSQNKLFWFLTTFKQLIMSKKKWQHAKHIYIFTKHLRSKVLLDLDCIHIVLKLFKAYMCA